MNRKLMPYINFLLDNNPSPFCDYIICKELLESDEKTVHDAYDWAVRFKLYTELLDDQFPDGSFGGFRDRITILCKGRHFITTDRAMMRMLDLSLDADDPMVSRTLDICKKYLSGEASLRNLATRDVARSLSQFDPDDIYVKTHRESAAERLEKSCENGLFSMEKWSGTDSNPKHAFFSYEINYIHSIWDCISEDTQRAWLSFEWNYPLWYNGAFPAVAISPSDPSFIFWLVRLENIKNFPLFGKFMAEKNIPYLYSLCERLVNKNDDIVIKPNNYFYHLGQYSESPRNKQHRKNDLLLRIIRILNKCN